jgi:ATP-dependent DNA helicase PIF1
MSSKYELTEEQQVGLEILNSGENVFLTGGAGSGKSYLIRRFLQEIDTKQMPILASTGAAAVLVGGRTFHSFFGLGIMDGGPEKTFEKGINDSKLIARLKRVEGFILDEVSMISGPTFDVAEALARKARDSQLPWGGMRVIVVGDFAQLPPVTRTSQREWCFLSERWKASGFTPVQLEFNQRVKDNEFLRILADVREGRVTSDVKNFLDYHLRDHDEDDDGTRLFPRRDQADLLNQKKLAQLPGEVYVSDSIYIGQDRGVDILKKNAPLPDRLELKEGCQVMFIQNDPGLRYVNGTRGTVVDCRVDRILVEKRRGKIIEVERTQFGLQDAEGQTIASVINFPLRLAYATTIHKSQGATLDDVWLDLTRLWEPGHAYVALSRLREPKGLKLLGWNAKSFIADPLVQRFYSQLE